MILKLEEKHFPPGIVLKHSSEQKQGGAYAEQWECRPGLWLGSHLHISLAVPIGAHCGGMRSGGHPVVKSH